MGGWAREAVLVGLSTSSRISCRSLIASPNWAFKRSFATTGSGATRYSKKARRPKIRIANAGHGGRTYEETNVSLRNRSVESVPPDSRALLAGMIFTQRLVNE